MNFGVLFYDDIAAVEKTHACIIISHRYHNRNIIIKLYYLCTIVSRQCLSWNAVSHGCQFWLASGWPRLVQLLRFLVFKSHYWHIRPAHAPCICARARVCVCVCGLFTKAKCDVKIGSLFLNNIFPLFT